MNKYLAAKQEKIEEYQSLINKLKVQLADAEYGKELKDRIIAKLETQTQEAGTLCENMISEIASLQDKYQKQIEMNHHHAYINAKQTKTIDNLGKTLERYEKENKALRELVSLWV